MRSTSTATTSTQRGHETQTTSTVASDALASGTRRRGTYRGGEMVIPIVEEEIHVGKREVEGGGVRVRTNVEERPVNEQVTLHNEEVHVERRRVDQPVDAATAANTFQEGTFEVREHGEEAVVQKEARVVEEVVINKEQQDRTETIQDTVRRTDVDVEQLPEQQTDVRSDTTRRGSGRSEEV